MTSREFRPLRRLLGVAAAVSLMALSGCVAYPAPGYPGGYAYAPYPGYAYAAPVGVDIGVGCCWGRWGWGHGWGGHWR